MKIPGRTSDYEAELIDALKESKNLFQRFICVVETTELKLKFENSIDNIDKSIAIIENDLTMNEIEQLVNSMIANIHDN